MNRVVYLNEILDLLRQELPTLKQRYGVESMGVFGSYVRDEQDSESDLDLLVTFYETPGLLKFIELEYYLTDRLGIKVDLVMKNALKPKIGVRVLQEVIPL
jgi:uncharacterized protein